MTETELLELKQQIDDAKSTIKNLEGRRDLLMEQLKEKWGLKTIAEAEKKVKSLETSIEKYDTQIEESTAELEKQLEDENTGEDDDD